ncbi:MAG: hypothetical protein ACK4YU_06315 [Paracoccus sp. (in: a-proteobacteria)]
MKKLVTMLVVIVIALAIVAGGRYYMWVANISNASTPYDEVGIGLHSYMPAFVQDWGCAKLQDSFGAQTLPPYGCAAADGGWR